MGLFDGSEEKMTSLPFPPRCLVTAALVSFLSVTALEAAPETQKSLAEGYGKTSIELGYGRYELPDPRYKKVFQEGREIYSLEVYQVLVSQNRHHLGLVTGVRKFAKKGKSTFLQETTKLSLLPVFLGLRYLLKIKPVSPWAELGVDIFSYTEDSLLKKTKGTALGYHAQAGLFWEIPGLESLKIKIYLRHSRAMAEENHVTVNLGGLEYGIGLAYAFTLH